MAQLLQICLFFFTLSSSGAELFLGKEWASQVFSRHRRANSPFEELRRGNLERECYEEKCSYEEAREVFEDQKKTDDFWNIYFDGDACTSAPCLNAGQCQDGIGAYTCFCRTGYQGRNCEIVIPKLCENNNGECQHFCKVEAEQVSCSCATGYYLGEDGKQCLSDEQFPCGLLKESLKRTIWIPELDYDEDVGNSNYSAAAVNVTDTLNSTIGPLVEEEPILPEGREQDRIVNGEDCPPGKCPWQALLVNEEKMGFCGGTILNEYYILSAAHCMNQSKSFTVVLGEYDTEKSEGREATHNVEKVLIHHKYIKETYNNDIAIIKLKEPIKFTNYIIPACLPEKEFAEKVLMKEKDGLISGFGRMHERGRQSTILQRLSVPYVDRHECIESSLFKITVNMFCAGYDKLARDACQGDSGGPHVTRFRDTWFISGVVSWGEGCAREGKYGVYTQVSRYIPWIKTVMKFA